MSGILVSSRVARAMVMEWEDGEPPHEGEDLDDDRAAEPDDLIAVVSRARMTAIAKAASPVDGDPDRRLEAMIGEPTF